MYLNLFAQGMRTSSLMRMPESQKTILARLESRQPYTFHLSAAVVEGVFR
jgi:hypothetical protein